MPGLIFPSTLHLNLGGFGFFSARLQVIYYYQDNINIGENNFFP
jgi:hypothetical protein